MNAGDRKGGKRGKEARRRREAGNGERRKRGGDGDGISGERR